MTEIVRWINDDRDLANVSRVCRSFLVAVDLDSDRRMRRLGLYNYAFGKAKWNRYFGDVGKEPVIASAMARFINGPCPIWPEKRVRDTHFLTLVPERLNGEQVTAEKLGRMLSDPQSGGHPVSYFCQSMIEGKWYSDQHLKLNTWILMTRHVLDSTWCKSYDSIEQEVTRMKRQSGQGYRLPKVIEAAVCIMTHAVDTGELIGRCEGEKAASRLDKENSDGRDCFGIPIRGARFHVVHCGPINSGLRPVLDLNDNKKLQIPQ